MDILKTNISGVYEIIRKPILDKRGSFERMFCHDTLSELLTDKIIKQINKSVTKKRGAVRGMHVQIGKAQETKMITCTNGEVFDVALDLRKDSSTFLNWTSLILNPKKNNMFVLPEGVAHGFQCLSNECEMIYFHTSNYTPKYDIGINILDPLASIEWPLQITEISERDKAFKFLDKDYIGVNA